MIKFERLFLLTKVRLDIFLQFQYLL